MILLMTDLTILKAIAIALVLFISAYILNYAAGIKVQHRLQAVRNQIDNLKSVQRADARKLRQEKWMRRRTNFILLTPFRLSKDAEEELNYSLERLGVRVKYSESIMKANQFNGIYKTYMILSMIFSLIILVFFSSIFGLALLVASLILWSTVPNVYINSKVKLIDEEIANKFTNLYTMVYFSIINKTGEPLEKILKSFSFTTDSEEMQKFVDNCINEIETFGELEALDILRAKYSSVAQVDKMLRLMKQFHNGGDVLEEMHGFSNELLELQEYAIQKKTERIIEIGQASFNVLMVILFIALASAVGTFFPQLMSVKSLF